MIFCNTLDSCRAADKYLEEHDLPSLSYHGDVPLDGRRQAIAAFAEGGNSADGSHAIFKSASLGLHRSCRQVCSLIYCPFERIERNR